MFCSVLLNTVFENGMFGKLIFFHSEIAQYKESVLTKSDKAKINRETKRKKAWERIRAITDF